MDHDHDHDHHDHDHDHDHDHGPNVVAVVEDLGPCKKLLKVEVAADEVKKEIDNRLNHLRRSVHIKGFRKGKAPRQRIEKLYGESVRDDARDYLMRQGYMKALKEQIGPENLLGEGTIENVDFSADAGLRFEVTLHTRPSFELADYENLEVRVAPVKVEDRQVEETIDSIRRARGELKPVEDPDAVVEGEDLVTCDVEVWLADEYETWAQNQEQGEEQDEEASTELKPLKEELGLQVQLPDGQLGEFAVEDLADSLTGLKVGEWGEAETELPQDFEVVEGRNEPATLRIKVTSIKRLFLPELTEEWAKEAGYDSVSDLRREVREELQQRLELVRRREVEEKALAGLLERTGVFDLPGDLVDKEVETAERRRMFELRLREGKSEEEAKAAAEEDRERIRAEVEQGLRSFFLLDEIARRQELGVTEGEVEARIARIAAARGDDPMRVRAELEKHNVLGQVRHDIVDEKARGFLRDRVKVIETED